MKKPHSRSDETAEDLMQYREASRGLLKRILDEKELNDLATIVVLLQGNAPPPPRRNVLDIIHFLVTIIMKLTVALAKADPKLEAYHSETAGKLAREMQAMLRSEPKP